MMRRGAPSSLAIVLATMAVVLTACSDEGDGSSAPSSSPSSTPSTPSSVGAAGVADR